MLNSQKGSHTTPVLSYRAPFTEHVCMLHLCCSTCQFPSPLCGPITRHHVVDPLVSSETLNADLAFDFQNKPSQWFKRERSKLSKVRVCAVRFGKNMMVAEPVFPLNRERGSRGLTGAADPPGRWAGKHRGIVCPPAVRMWELGAGRRAGDSS